MWHSIMLRIIPRIIFSLIFLGLSPQTHLLSVRANGETRSDDQLEQRIAALIQQLGSESYAARKQAEQLLIQIGIRAMDQLQIAALHSDPQIASSALYVQQSIPQVWVWESDPFSVQQILEGYGAADPTDRGARIERLAYLERGEGVQALCRIVRYEIQTFLSRLASLHVIKLLDRLPEDQARASLKVVEEMLGDSPRDPAIWLRKFAEEQRLGNFDLDWWKERLADEQALLRSLSRETRKSIVTTAFEIVCERAIAHGHREAAIDIARSMIDWIDMNSYRLTDVCRWSIAHGIPEFVSILATDYPALVHRFEQEPELGYLLAHSLCVRGRNDEGELQAKKVFARSRPEGSPTQVERYTVAVGLGQIGCFDWAERELWSAIDKADLTSRATHTCLHLLSEYLVDGQAFGAAARAWQPIIDRLENEPLFARQLTQEFLGAFDGQVLPYIKGHYQYYLAMDAKQRGDWETCRLHLSQAVDLYHENVDFYIALDQVEGDEAWKQSARERIDRAIRRIGEKIQEVRLFAAQGGPREVASVQSELAQLLNESAWLSANTHGDTAEALAFAKEACKLSPNVAAYVDTLARAYFADGQLERAVETQKRAVAMDVHSRSMKRQLELFERALAEKSQKSAP